LYRKSKHTFYVQQLLSENRAVYETMSKNMAESEGPQMTSQYGALRYVQDKQSYTPALQFICPRAQAHASTRAYTNRKICNNYCFSTATVIRESFSMLRYTHIAFLVCHNHMFSPWNLNVSHTTRSTVLPEKLIGSQLFKKFPAFYGTHGFIIIFTTARHLSLS
jgi:hypothetical protein